MNGSGLGRRVRGERITSLAQLHVGHVYIEHCTRFDAVNLIKVLSLGCLVGESKPTKAEVIFVSPANTKLRRMPSDSPFFILDHGGSTRIYRIGSKP